MPNLDNEQREKAEADLKRDVDFLFLEYIQIETPRALKTISEYYTYLAEHIDPKRYRVDVGQILLDPFEAVALVLKERLQFYPHAIKEQVEEVFRESKLLKTLGLLANLSPEDLRELRMQRGVFGMSRWILRMFGLSFNPPSDYGVSQDLLFETRLALKRLSQILKYATTLQMPDYEEAFIDVKENYDPNLINKNKLLALVSILHVEVDQVEDSAEKKLILSKLETIEQEIRKPAPRWGTIVTWCFVLFSFVADLKSLKPDIYDKPYQVLSEIVNILHTEGGAHSGRKSLPPPIESPRAAIPAVVETTVRREHDGK